MGSQELKKSFALIFFTFSLIECFAQTYSKQAVYINQSDALWEMFVFDTAGNFEYKTGSTFGWVGVDGIGGEGTYSLRDNCTEIQIIGKPVAKLNSSFETIDENIEGCRINFKSNIRKSDYDSGMFVSYLIINNDTIKPDSLLIETLHYYGTFDSIIIFVSPNAQIKYVKQKHESNQFDLYFDYCFEYQKKYFSKELIYLDELHCLHYKDKLFYKWPDSLSVCDLWMLNENKTISPKQ